jgi:hypothetical protein
LSGCNEGRRQAADGHGQDEPVTHARPALQPRGWPLLAPKSGAEYASSAVSITVVLSMDLLLYWSASFRLKG